MREQDSQPPSHLNNQVPQYPHHNAMYPAPNKDAEPPQPGRHNQGSLAPSAPKAGESQPSADRISHSSNQQSSFEKYHRPFVKASLTNHANGLEKQHYSEYERRLLNDRLLGHDQSVTDLRTLGHGSHEPHNHTANSQARSHNHRDSSVDVDKVATHRGMHSSGDAGSLEQPLSLTSQSRPIKLGDQSRSVGLDQTQLVKLNDQTQRLPPSSHQHSHYHGDRTIRMDHGAVTKPADNHAKDSSSTVSKHTVSRDHGKKELPHAPLPQPHPPHTQPPPHTKIQPQPLPQPPPVTSHRSPVSKLDLREQHLQEARLSGLYNSDDSDHELSDRDSSPEDRKRQRLLVIGSGPPQTPDKSPQKLKFLRRLGITTPDVKRDVRFRQRVKQRRIYRERSLSPVELEEQGAGPDSDHCLQIPTHIHPDDLNHAVEYKQKACFLYMLGLEGVNPERRQREYSQIFYSPHGL